MIRSFLISIFVLASLFGAYDLQAQERTLQSQFDQANEAYFQRDFPKAIQLYQDLESRGLVSGDLFYNLGNTYYRQGEVGEAVYYYLKALRYSPRDRDLVANLRYVLSKRVDQIEPGLLSKVYHTLFFWGDLMTLKELLLTTALFYGLFFIILALRLMKKRTGLTFALVLLLLLNLLLLPTAVAKYVQEKMQTIAVIISPQASVFSEPTDSSIKLFELHEGTYGKVLDQTKDFIKMNFDSGKVGWIESKNVKKTP
ncbi:MAG: tetratricopeptide repeat protein [Deltaproteobacteria bacterium]|nr:tetratricopeptide repeat protein [Deltaproteobacteria bacterium]